MFIFGWFVTGQGILFMAIIATLFGGSAVAYAFALGGANVTPAMLAQGFAGLSLLRREGLRGFLDPIKFGTPPFWLLLLTIWGVTSAFVLPRFFEGQFLVATFDRSAGRQDLAFIKPVSMNTTQAMYAFLALIAFVMARTLLSRPGGMLAAARALLWVAGLNTVFALIDLAQYHLGMFPILSYLKNANYLMLGGEVAGLMRITGTFPETSMFSQYTLAIIAFTHTLWMHGLYRNWARALTIMNGGLLLISTSGTAYVGLAICMAVALGYTVWRLLREGSAGPYRLYIQMTVVGVILGIAVVLFVPPALQAITDYFDIVIGKKLTSQSGAVRAQLNGYAWDTFVSSVGLGGGLGCCRASSFAMVLLSNVGWVGTALFLLFVIPLLLGKLPAEALHDERVVVIGARRAVFAALVSALLVGLVYDLGFLFYITAAMAWLPKPSSATSRPQITT